MVKNKALIPDCVTGGWKLSHGAYWDKTVMNNALNMEHRKMHRNGVECVHGKFLHETCAKCGDV